MLSLISRLARSPAISWASRTDRARRSSLVTTKVSPARHAARASRSPARFLFLPGKAMINIDAFGFNAEGCQGITLGGEVLLFRGHACVTDHDLRHVDQCVT